MSRTIGTVQPEYDSSCDERFNALDIRYPVCNKIVPKSEDDQICECNLPIKLHGRENVKLAKPPKGPWSEKNTTSVRDVAHGRLLNRAWFARLDINTNLNIVRELLFTVWKFSKPKLIMSIIGGANHFTLNDRLETNFINGIINVAIRSNIWLITNGYNNGLVQLVGQAIRKAKLRQPKQKMVALAICKWGSVKNPQKLIYSKKKETKQIVKKTNSSDTSDDDEETKLRHNDEHDLDMNHTHYLMLDDARYRYIDTGDFRTRLCSRITRLDRADDPNNVLLFDPPAVTLVVEGGNATISNIYYDLKSNIPVVIIDGTGRIADFFSHWLLYTKEFDKDLERRETIYGINELKPRDPVTEISNQQLSRRSGGRTDIRLKLHEVYIDLNSKKLADVFSKYETRLRQDLEKVLYRDEDSKTNKDRDPNVEKKNLVETALEQVMYCLQPSIRSNITVFNLTSENDLSETIFRRISTTYEKLSKRKKSERHGKRNHAQSDSKEKEETVERTPLLELAMDWDCIDVAKEFVFQNSLENISDVESAFKDALKKNLYTFVYEFIKLGVDPAEIFFPRKTFTDGTDRYQQFIADLYNNDIVDKASTHLKAFIEEDTAFIDKEINSIEGLNVILRTLIGDYMHKLYFDSLEKGDEDRVEIGLTRRSRPTEAKESKDFENIESLTSEEKNQMAFDHIMRDLFLWAILMNYIEMAKVFLAHAKYRICPALIATKILKEYYRKAAYGELKDGYMESANYFENYAIDCLNKCNKSDENKACEIVLQRNELYGYVTCLQVAADAEDKLFIATPCCVEAMNNIWYDKLLPDQSRKRDQLALVVGFLSFGLAAPPFVAYRECKQSEIGETLEATLNSYGINYCDPYALEYPRYLSSNLEVNRYVYQVKNFHQSLLMKFCYHLIMYCFFLLLFSYVLLFNFNPPTDAHPSIHWTEILTIILVSCMLIEEIHYFLSQDSWSWGGRIENYFRDLFKLLTLFAFILFYIGLIVRFTNTDTEEDFTAARIIMAIDIELWWLRFLSFMIVIPFLGPHLVAIAQMLKDLLFFICIIVIVMAGYGVASRSMVYYPVVNNFTTETGGYIDPSFDGRSVFRQILYPVYYLMYGNLDSELGALDSNPNAGWSIATHVLLAIHMLFVNILLTNLLIAIFSKRFDQVYDDTKNIWHSQQYLFTREYYTRSPFLPPISLIYDVYYLCRMFIFFIRRKLHKSADRKVQVFKMIPKNKSCTKDWYEFEGASTYEYAHAEVKALCAASTKLSSGPGAHNIEDEEESINKQKDSNNVSDNLKQIQENMKALNKSMEEMKGELNSFVK